MILYRVFGICGLHYRQPVRILERVLSKYRYSKLGFCASRNIALCRITSVSYQLLSKFSVVKVDISANYHWKRSLEEPKLKMPEPKPFERLPKNVVPSHYNLFLKPDLKKFVFEGREIIDIEV